MKRSAPMKRTGFKRQGLPPRPVKTIDYSPRPRDAAVSRHDGKARMVVPVPKRIYVRDRDYRSWVASLDCMHCGISGYSQCAHSDDNGAGAKGMGIKSSDDTSYPACGPHPRPDGSTDPGCHWLIGTSGRIPKAERRALEATYSAKTRELRQKPSETKNA